MRLDCYLYSIKKYGSRTKAAEAVSRGEVLYNGKTVSPSREVVDGKLISYKSESVSFVSVGAYKLEKAIEDFGVQTDGLVFADIGASAGGFTDVLLKRGAKRVYAVDVGESLINEGLKNNPKVIVKDNINARNLEFSDVGETVDGIVTDVSFISLTYILLNFKKILKDNGYIIALIKPQFECGKKFLNKNGIVTDKKARAETVKKIYDYSLSIGLYPKDFTVSPIHENKNTEYLILLSLDNKDIISADTVNKKI